MAGVAVSVESSGRPPQAGMEALVGMDALANGWAGSTNTWKICAHVLDLKPNDPSR